MGLTPNIRIPELYRSEIQPSKTYALDLNTGEIRGFIDRREAIQQFIRKAIITPRYDHLVYTPNYGCEIRSLIGKGYSNPFIEAEIVRMVTEALIYDERINRIYDFEINIVNEEVYINLAVDTVEGTLNIREVI